VARAVEYAHRRGVLHRDLKPGNILLDAAGQPLVTDFGLARRLDETGSLVPAGIEGTAAYMAPEQASGASGSVTTAADIYSLGAILYELLTGRPPFKGASDVETLLLVLREDPVPPRRLEPRLSRDLETICLKCLQKEPGRRYRSAAELADDLDNWLAGRPINARPVGAAGRLVRWARRNPVPASAAALVLATVGLAFVLVTQSRNTALDLAESNDELAQRERGQRQRAETEAKANARLADDNKKLARQERTQRRAVEAEAALRDLQAGVNTCERPGGAPHGLLAMAQALAGAVRAENPAVECAVRLNLADWERASLPLRLLLRHGPENYNAAAPAVAFSPDGLTLVTASSDPSQPPAKDARSTRGILRLWDARTGTARSETISFPAGITTAVFSPDGRMILAGDATGLAWLLDAGTGKKLGPPLRHSAMVLAALFTPDGKRVIIAGGEGRIWDVATRQAVGAPLAHTAVRGGRNEVLVLALSRDGQTVLTGSMAGARLWDVASGLPRGQVLAHDAEITSVAFSPDGRLLVIGGGRHVMTRGGPGVPQGVVQVWGVGTGQQIGSLPHPGYVRQVRFSPDGTLIATAGMDGTAHLWSTATGQPVGLPLRHSSPVTGLAFSPDGRFVITAAEESASVRFWEPHSGSLVRVLGQRWLVKFLEFSPDGTTLRTAVKGGAVLAWDVTRASPQAWVRLVGGRPKRYSLDPDEPASANRYVLTASGETTRCVFSPDRRTLLAAHGDGAVLLDAATGRLAGPSLDKRGLVSGAAFSRDGRRVWLCGLDATLAAWDTTTGRCVVGPMRGPGQLLHLALSPDGKMVAAGRRSGPAGVGLWSAETGRLLGDLRHPGPVWRVAFSPDGGTLLSAGEDGTVRLWDPATGKPRGKPLAHPHRIYAAAFSPDGKAIAVGCGQEAPPAGEFRLWDVASGRMRGRPVAFRGLVMAVAFRADGKAVAAGSMAGVARTYQVTDGEPLGPDLPHPGTVEDVAFAPSGRLLLTGGVAGVRLWEPVTGRQVGPLQPVAGEGAFWATFGPDARRFYMGDDKGFVYCHETPVASAEPPEQITLRTQLETGQTRDAGGVLNWLGPDEWQACRRRLERLGRLPGPPDLAAWHRAEADRAELAGNRYTAWWHESQLLKLGSREPAQLARAARAAVRAGRPEAEALLSEALRGPAPEPDLWRERGLLRLGRGRMEEAATDLDAAVKHGRTDWRNWHARGTLHAQHGRWPQAAADFAEAVAQPGARPGAYSDLALARLCQAKPADHRAACRAVLEQLEQRGPDGLPAGTAPGRSGDFLLVQPGQPGLHDPAEVAQAVWVCCLAPELPVDAGVLMKLTTPDAAHGEGLFRRPGTAQVLIKGAVPASLNAGDSYPTDRALGALLYRTAQYAKAVQHLEMIQAGRGQASPACWLLLALAQGRAGDTDMARQWLEKATGWIKEAHRAAGVGGGLSPWDSLPWQEQAALELLRAQAERLLTAPAPLEKKRKKE
jgi:WD40 repeat protein/tetratricopeptide (TPR) repeat protein